MSKNIGISNASFIIKRSALSINIKIGILLFNTGFVLVLYSVVTIPALFLVVRTKLPFGKNSEPISTAESKIPPGLFLTSMTTPFNSEFFKSAITALKVPVANMDTLIAVGTFTAWGFSIINARNLRAEEFCGLQYATASSMSMSSFPPGWYIAAINSGCNPIRPWYIFLQEYGGWEVRVNFDNLT